MKKVYFLFFFTIISFSCEKDEPDFAMEFVGVYNAKEVNVEGTFPLLIDKIDDNTILIETKLYGIEKSYIANIDKYDFIIPSQDFNGYEFKGSGKLSGNNLIMHYNLSDGFEHKIIATK